MTPLRTFIIVIAVALIVTIPVQVTDLRAESKPVKWSNPLQEEDSLEKQKLILEIQELRGKATGWNRVERLASILAPSLTLLGLIIGAIVILVNARNRRRLETITNLKKDLASENTAIRVASAHALADYPREALPLLIASLSNTKTAAGNPVEEMEEDHAHTAAVKDSLRQIGKMALVPLIKELQRLDGSIKSAIQTSDDYTRRLHKKLPLAIFLKASSGRPTDLQPIVEIIKSQSEENLEDKDIKRILKRLRQRRPLRSASMAYENGVEVIAYLLGTHIINGLSLRDINLSGYYLWKVSLAKADLSRANLSGAHLWRANLSGARLSMANLSEANLWMANLSGADLTDANLSGASLWNAVLSGATFLEAKGFREIKNFEKARFIGVKGLSREDLEYAKSRGAILRG